MAATDLVLAFTGASGSPYGVRLLEILLQAGRTVHLTISPAAVEVMDRELDRTLRSTILTHRSLSSHADGDLSRIHYHHFRDFQSGIASGSFLTAGMVICPCSMGTIAAIAPTVSRKISSMAPPTCI